MKAWEYMTAMAIEIGAKLNELLHCLDKDIEQLRGSLSLLNELRSLVIKRDEDSLGRLLESIQTESDTHKGQELKRYAIRKELALALGCGSEQVTLSKLEAVLPEEEKAQVAERKAQLKALINKLKKEHLSTALLLSECARFNRLLLKSILNFGSTGTVYYDSDGSTKQQSDTAFVNLQL
ncbi:MAG: flagellar export chaperone FlgN [Planctomycetota bacterium]|nr:MAG: flagellar export chaperone FlgN [Planctomycetota bacterium]